MKAKIRYGSSMSPKGKGMLNKYYTCDVLGHENQPLTSICVERFCSRKGGICHICTKALHQGHEIMSYRGFIDNMRQLQREHTDKGKHLNRHVSQEDLKDSYQKKLIYISIIENLQKFQKALQEQIFKYEEKLNNLFSKYIPDNLVFQQNKHLTPLPSWKANNIQISAHLDHQNLIEHTSDPNKLLDMIDCRIIQNPQTAKAILQKLTDKYIYYMSQNNQYSSSSQFYNQSPQGGSNPSHIPGINSGTPTVQLTTLFSNENNNINLKNGSVQKQLKEYKAYQERKGSLTDLGVTEIEKELVNNDQLEIGNKFLYDNLKTHLKKIKMTMSEFFRSILTEKQFNIFSPNQSPPRQQDQSQIDLAKGFAENQNRSNSKNIINPYRTGMWKVHQQAIKDIVSLGKNVIASASQEKNIKIWDLTTGRQTCELEGHEKEVNQLDYFPKLGILASCSNDKTIRLWKKGAAEKQWNNYATLKGHAEGVRSVCFLSHHGILLSGGYDNLIRIWSVQALNQIQSFEQNHVVNCLVELEFNNFLSSDGTNMNIWELYQKQRDPVRVIEAHDNVIQQIVYNKQNQLIATASRDATVKIWSSATFELLKLLKEDMDVYTVCFVQDYLSEQDADNSTVTQAKQQSQTLPFPSVEQIASHQKQKTQTLRRNSFSGRENYISNIQSEKKFQNKQQPILPNLNDISKDLNKMQIDQNIPQRKSRDVTPTHLTKQGIEYTYDIQNDKQQLSNNKDNNMNQFVDQSIRSRRSQRNSFSDISKENIGDDTQQTNLNNETTEEQQGNTLKLAVGLWSGGQKDEGSMHIWILKDDENRKFKVSGIDNGVTHVIQDLEREKLISCHIDGKIRIFNKIV